MSDAPVITAEKVSLFYGATQALFEVDLEIPASGVTALIGPSGCGKSSFLRCLNRMNDTIAGTRMTGTIRLEGEDIFADRMDVVVLRARVGMVFQKPNPFPKSIFDNVAYGLRVHGLAPARDELEMRVEQALQAAGLWKEVADRLKAPALSLSGGQQQRLCIARALAVGPQVLLMDEPCSALDPIATAAVEEMISELAASRAIVIVTHNMAQARRVAARTAFFHLGQLVEIAPTAKLFGEPEDERTQGYVLGIYG